MNRTNCLPAVCGQLPKRVLAALETSRQLMDRIRVVVIWGHMCRNCSPPIFGSIIDSAWYLPSNKQDKMNFQRQLLIIWRMKESWTSVFDWLIQRVG